MPEDDDVTVSVNPAERYVLSLPQLKLAGFPLPPQGIVGGKEESKAHGFDSDEDPEDDDEDVGCPVAAVGEEGHGRTGAPAWLQCDEEGRWGETRDLVPSLEEAQRILGGLNAIKVGGVTCCFYETLGGSGGVVGGDGAPVEGEAEEGETRAPPYRLLAMDCEMCQTTEGMEVTRLTVVDGDRKVVLDSFVKPHNEIVDHLTKYSGITPQIMAECTTRLEQVQVALLRLVRAETILVGHSLEQDLMVTGLIHLRCIDTAVLYPHPRGPQYRFALRVLSKKYLGRVIQNSSEGHCSQEDAEAALDLVQAKMEHGPSFGTEEGEGRLEGEDTQGRESFLDRLGTKHGKRCTLLDQSDTLVKVIRGSAASAVVCRSNEEVLSKAKAQARQPLPPHFLWGSLAATRPLTLEAVEARRKRQLHQQQQQQLEAEATAAAAAAAGDQRSTKRLKVDGGRIASLSRNGSSSSLSVTTTVLRAESGSNSSSSSSSSSTTTTVTTATHTKFLYEEKIMTLVETDLLRADQQLSELFDALPTNTLLLVLAQPDVALPTQLHSQRLAALHSRRATLPWTQEHEDILEELSKAAQKGVVMMRVR